ncbi:MAG: transcription termination factor Rho [Kofleriaceae bacterium]|nr:transcription termination factor Rho [Kofleriaceae bacterium]
MNLNELKSQSHGTLSAKAKSLDLALSDDMDSGQILLAILRSHSESGGTISGTGTLEILSDGFGFLRNSHSDYTPSPQDIYVSPSQIRRFRLSTGDTIIGQVRPPRESERYFALLRVDSVNNLSTDKVNPVNMAPSRAIHPSERLYFAPNNLCARLWQMLCPVSKGQRVLLFAPPQSKSTTVLLEIAKAAYADESPIRLLTLLVAQRPEVVSEFQDADIGAVVSSTFDEPAARHTQLAEMVFENARKKADRGEDVLVLVDSLSRLAQAASQNAPSGMVNLPAGLNFKGVQYAKRIFATGRNIEDSGSVTLIAILRDANEPVDDYLRQELSGTANATVHLSAQAAAEGCALPLAEAMRNCDEERFLNAEERALLAKLRHGFDGQPVSELKAMEDALLSSESDHHFLETFLGTGF